MIKGYYRPQNIIEAVDLLNNSRQAIPIGGGTSLNKHKEEIVVIDLQDLDLAEIKKNGKNIIIGSMTTLEQLKEYFRKNESLQSALKIEGSKNQRTLSSLGGFLKLAGGRSPLLTCLLTLGCTVFYADEIKAIPLNEFLVERKNNKKLITHISIKDPTKLQFESVSRSPLDLPIVCCAVAQYGNESTVAIGGFGEAPQLIPTEYFAEKDNSDLSELMHFSTDEWASANYRASITQIILKRLRTQRNKGD